MCEMLKAEGEMVFVMLREGGGERENREIGGRKGKCREEVKEREIGAWVYDTEMRESLNAHVSKWGIVI